MKTIIIILTLTVTFILLPKLAHANFVECEKCSTSIVRETEQRLQRLNKKSLTKFLCTFGESCSLNVEFSEYSNELLFLVLEKHPETFVACMRNGSVEHEYVYKELAYPLVYERITCLIDKIKGTKGDEIIKKRILNALSEASTKG